MMGLEATGALFGDGGTMNAVDLANKRVFAEVKRLCLMGLDTATLRRRVVERLKSTVTFEA